MIFDKVEHQQIVSELIRNANFPGAIVEMAVELKKAVAEATVASPSHSDANPA